MRYILIPVKDLTRAKQRLAGLMSQEERTALAWALLESTFAAAAEVRNADKTAIVTLYPPAIELAEKYQFEVILEEQQISESVSVDFGSREARMRGATSVLRLPIDLPLIRTDDIESLLNMGGTSPSTVIVPSRDGTGTNAILRNPPDLFPSHFGPGSLEKHVAEAGRTGAACTLVENYRIALDIDEPEDIQELLRVAGESRISDLLHRTGVIDRLKL